MNFIRNHWYHFTIFIFVGLSFFIGFYGHTKLSSIQIILMYSLMALSIHQFEEYVFPGGVSPVINKATYKEDDDYDHYPGNTLSICIVNISAYLFYVLAIIFPQLIWFGLATMLFNIMQVFGHGISMNKALNTWYNPGMFTSFSLFAPISIYYIIYIYNEHLINIYTWIVAIITFFIILVVTIILPVQTLKNRNTKYVISDWQIEQFKKVTTFAQRKS